MKTKEIREFSVNEIEKHLRDVRTELLSMQLRKNTGQLERPHRLRELRHTVARLETIKREKSIA